MAAEDCTLVATGNVPLVRCPSRPANPHRLLQAGRSVGVRLGLRGSDRRLLDPSRSTPRSRVSRMTPGRNRGRTRRKKGQRPPFFLFRSCHFSLPSPSSFEDPSRIVLETQGVSRAPFSGMRPLGAAPRPHEAVGTGRERPRLPAAWCGLEGSPFFPAIFPGAGGSLTSGLVPAGRLGGSRRTTASDLLADAATDGPSPLSATTAAPCPGIGYSTRNAPQDSMTSRRRSSTSLRA